MTPMNNSHASGSVVLTHAIGLHARPSVKLTKLAKKYRSAIEIGLGPEGPWIDAKSIVKVMAARVPQGSQLHFRAAGNDADDAVAALIDLVESDFGEAGANAANG
jgi:phosphocarrier protein